MEACNDSYLFVQRLFGIGLRSSQPSIISETLQASPSRDGTHFRSQRLGTVTLARMALRTLSLKEGRFRILTADDHDQSTCRRKLGNIHGRALLAI